MPQNVNPYNTQNGTPPMYSMISNPSMGGNGQTNYPMNGNQNGMQNWGAPQPIPQQLTQQPTPMDMQGWKMYNPAPNKPLVGRWVMGFEEIKPKDVPMDGSFAIFPQTDQYGNLSCIYAMIWGSDGTIKPYRFLPEMIAVDQVPDQEPVSDPVKDILANFTSTMNDRLDSLERRIGDILTPFTVSQNTKNTGSNKRTTTKEE